VFGSPFFIVEGEGFWGNDRLPQLERWLAPAPSDMRRICVCGSRPGVRPAYRAAAEPSASCSPSGASSWCMAAATSA
jgi:hypothetical protein